MGRNKYPEETVAKILDAALELFCAQGYEGTSIQDIVDRLDGMTKVLSIITLRAKRRFSTPHLIGQWLRLLSNVAQRLVSAI